MAQRHINMNLIELTHSVDETEALFPSSGDDGEDVQATQEAQARAADAMGVKAEELVWHLPDVFAVRYGSSYVATASHGDQRVRFLMDAGTFQEGDDQV
jgi:hypothetical protein